MTLFSLWLKMTYFDTCRAVRTVSFYVVVVRSRRHYCSTRWTAQESSPHRNPVEISSKSEPRSSICVIFLFLNPVVINMNTTATSIQNALDQNLVLQSEVGSLLLTLARRKVRNRQMAQKLVEIYMLCNLKLEQEATPYYHDRDDSFYSNLSKQLRMQQREQYFNTGVAALAPTIGSVAETTSKPNVKSSPSAKQVRNQWGYNDSRKWTLHFFIDPQNNIPEPNFDTQFRHNFLEGICDETTPIFSLKGNLDVYNWSNEELQSLTQAVEEVRRQQEDAEESSTNVTSAVVMDSQIDFDKVAQIFNSRAKPKTVKRGTKRRSVTIPRIATECRNKYLYFASPKINNGPWTKQESRTLLEVIDSLKEVDHDNPPWDIAALTLQTSRTPWQVFTHFQHLSNFSKRVLFTVKSDELLLKYVASLGPRFVLNVDNTADICRVILPNSSPAQIAARCMRTLLNPNFFHEPWSEEEERKLVVLIKVYRDSANPITKAALHFPHRALKSVWDKWERSLNPEFLIRPWTKEEDEALLATVEHHEGGWIGSSAEISNEFPSRRTKQLYNRWLELIDEESLVRHQHALLKNKAAKENFIVASKETVFHPDDFVVRTKRKITDT